MPHLRTRSSIVWQMRLALILMGLLGTGSLFAGILALNDIQRVQGRLSREALPELERVAQFSDRLDSLKGALSEFALAKEPAVLDNTVWRARTLIGDLAAMAASDDRLASPVAQLHNAFWRSASARSEIGDHRVRVRQAVQEATRLERIVLALLDGMVVDLSSTFNKPQAIASDRPRDLLDHAARIGALSHLQSIAGRMFELISSLSLTRTPDELQALRERIAFNLRSAVATLTQLPDDIGRRELARSIADLRMALIGEGGLVEMQARLIDAEAVMGLNEQELAALIGRIDILSRDGVTSAQNRIKAAAAQIDETVSNAFLQEVALGGLALVLFALTVLILVERQIIARLARLALAVRRIADGHHEHRTGVDGSDELGEMARALETFRRNATELERSNAELSRFAYAAAHDLRSPLRGIRDLAEWTIEDAGDMLPAACDTNLGMLLQRVDRLSNLLGQLLDYSRVGHECTEVETVDLAALPGEIVDLLGAGNRFSLDVSGDSGFVETKAGPFRRVMLNLLGNAIKHHDRNSGQLEVHYHLAEDRLRVSITDDGPSIPAEYHEKVFDLFQTLRTRDEVEGSGMGLAIIRKLIEHYGGEISVASTAPDARGCTFSFDWPAISVEFPDRLVA